jgi:hypothetical protein
MRFDNFPCPNRSYYDCSCRWSWQVTIRLGWLILRYFGRSHQASRYSLAFSSSTIFLPHTQQDIIAMATCCLKLLEILSHRRPEQILDQLLYPQYLSAQGWKATSKRSRAFNFLAIGSVFCSFLLRRSKVLGFRGQHLIKNVWPGWYLLGNNCRDSLKAYPSPVCISISWFQSHFLVSDGMMETFPW